MAYSYITGLVCAQCNSWYPDEEPQTFCARCDYPLTAQYDLSEIRKALPRNALAGRENSLWRYHEVLPVRHLEYVRSLGEGMTPLARLSGIARALGLSELWVKDESFNPTGSFKARGLAVAVSKASELGMKKVCMPSAGNAGGALAAYAAGAGMEAAVFVPRDTPVMNVEECRWFGAEVVLVEGVISDAARVMKERVVQRGGWFDMSTMKEPYRLEGKKTMGYELAEQCNWKLPDVIVYPTGGGTGLIGMWKAFQEMEQLGWIGTERPRMVCVQAAGCAPIVEAFNAGAQTASFWNNAATLASGLRVPKAFADRMILQALYQSHGTAVSVADEDIVREMKTVARSDGLLMCPEGAATIAALRKLVDVRFIGRGDRIVVYNTGSPYKYMEVLRPTFG